VVTELEAAGIDTHGTDWEKTTVTLNEGGE
jgi:hypothetical protein